jgi:hypothetical protein
MKDKINFRLERIVCSLSLSGNVIWYFSFAFQQIDEVVTI